MRSLVLPLAFGISLTAFAQGQTASAPPASIPQNPAHNPVNPVQNPAQNPAAPGNPGASKLQDACREDIGKFCKDVQPGQGRMAACLNSKNNQLSASCKKEWGEAKARTAQRRQKVEAEVRKSCGEDIQKFCAKEPPGQGKIAQCLNQHSDKLSPSCKDLQANFRERVSKLFG